MRIDYTQRLAKLADIPEVDVVALVPGANMVYFTGLHFHLHERPIIALYRLSDATLSFIIPELELPKLEERPDLEALAFTWTDADGYMGQFRQAVHDLNLHGRTLGADGLTMRLFEWLAFQEANPSLRVKDVAHPLLRIRARKTPEEIEAIRRAIRISETALDHLLAWVEPGMTERSIAARLSQELAAQGSERDAFEPLVQTGPNSALPHGLPGDRKLVHDEFLLIDFGGVVDGYPADITRTFCLGTPSAEMQRIYDAVLRANEAARAAAGPGVPCSAVDRAARDVIAEAGYAQYFIHRTGHGLGLEVHELPQIAAGVQDILEPGMVFTIEPGIYIPDLGGVRIEDNVVITQDGIEVLTSYPRRLTVTR